MTKILVVYNVETSCIVPFDYNKYVISGEIYPISTDTRNNDDTKLNVNYIDTALLDFYNGKVMRQYFG